MENEIETFEKELNSIIGICNEKIKEYGTLLKEYEAIKGSALSPNLRKRAEELGIVRKTSDAEPVEILPEREETRYYLIWLRRRVVKYMLLRLRLTLDPDI
jgi:hypothetical protein